jgi:hypothetical protein
MSSHKSLSLPNRLELSHPSLSPESPHAIALTDYSHTVWCCGLCQESVPSERHHNFAAYLSGSFWIHYRGYAVTF